jgi:hypothetical protein
MSETSYIVSMAADRAFIVSWVSGLWFDGLPNDREVSRALVSQSLELVAADRTRWKSIGDLECGKQQLVAANTAGQGGSLKEHRSVVDNTQLDFVPGITPSWQLHGEFGILGGPDGCE